MNYQTYEPHSDLKSLINFYWTLEVPATLAPQKQRIVPDGGIELAFILGDDIKRYTSDNEFVIQPRAMILGQQLKPFYIEPVGYVNTFSISFYPYGLANFISEPIRNLVNKETPIDHLFEESAAHDLERKIIAARGTSHRIEIVESFLFDKLSDKSVIDAIIKDTMDLLYSSKGSASINDILKEDSSKRRQLERGFQKQIGISPKQLGRVIRLQGALKMLLNNENQSLAGIAYESGYYDQAHFIKDFKEFTGVSPKYFLGHKHTALSSLFYK